ncbi:hypothetical protein [Pseudoalteromonas denitrificans]|uniref:Uncharacterized protein n=1 Tax=Pseudoalteromonas denitrificans DSM 6059 TaxID=1123010 RepID=A0A1I1GMS6_9GAMM|nr:hypothetical protein [Pseudoalteromonas denitrificans]SFC13047.1 hypothetical protein SAMN02745724_00968 [Pseudoalteromonas denitrificans DSM 6059]
MNEEEKNTQDIPFVNDDNIPEESIEYNGVDEIEETNTNKVAIIVGKLAMPTTVILVLITCLSGYFLNEAAFTPVVGMIAPVVMALIMVIKEASVGKDEDPGVKDREGERNERTTRYSHDKEIKLAQLERDERVNHQNVKEHARQFDMLHSSTQEFVDLIREMNTEMTVQMTKPKSTELAIGDTKIKISDGGANVETSKDVK